MKTWLRKLRGVVSIGAIWGIACSVLGFALGAIGSMIGGISMLSVVSLSLQHGVLGFVLGSGFAGVLTIFDGRKTFEELTPGRAALWGALIGGVASPIVGGLITSGLGIAYISLDLIVAVACTYGVATAGLAAGTVSLARRAPAELGGGTVSHDSRLLGDSGESGVQQIESK